MAEDTAAAAATAAEAAARPGTPTQPATPDAAAAAARAASPAQASPHEEAEAAAQAEAAAASSPARIVRAATPTSGAAAASPNVAAASSPSSASPNAAGATAHPPPKTPSRPSDSPVESSSAGAGPLGLAFAAGPPHHPPAGGGRPRPPVPFRGPLPGGMMAGPPGGGGAGGARRLPPAMCELTPVIRNTSEADFHDHDSSAGSSPDGGGPAARTGGAARRREQFLSLSVPASMGKDDDGGAGGGGGGGLPGQLQQRPRRPLPQASSSQGGGGGGVSGAVLRLDVPIPPRGSSLRSSGSSKDEAGGLGPGAGAPPRTPFLQMDSPPGPAAVAAPVVDAEGGQGAPPPEDFPMMPPPAVRSHSAGNLDMHSMVQTIREHLSRQRDGSGSCDDRDNEEWVDPQARGGPPPLDRQGQDQGPPPREDAEARLRLAQALEATWDSPARSLHRRPGPRALRGPESSARDELAHQAGLPPPSILHPSLPRHPDPQEHLREPYCPNRENSFEVGVKRVSREELESIFKAGGGRGGDGHGQCNGPTPRSSNGADGVFPGVVPAGGAIEGPGGGRPPLKAPGDLPSHNHHPQVPRASPPRHPGLPSAIPLSERDWSIPSIRLASHLHGSSVSHASYTCSEDDYTNEEGGEEGDDYTEEDNLYRSGGNGDQCDDDDYYDEATISTAGSLDVSGHGHMDFSGHGLRWGGAEAAMTEGAAGGHPPRPAILPGQAAPIAPAAASSLDREVVIEGGMSAFSAAFAGAAGAPLASRRSEDLSDSAAAVAFSLSAPSGEEPVEVPVEEEAAEEAAKRAEPGEDRREERDDGPQIAPSSPLPPIEGASPVDNDAGDGPSSPPTSPPEGPSSRPRRRRAKDKSSRREKERRNQDAIAWLRTVEVGGISEAASSKFLTGAAAAKAEAKPPSPSSVLQPHPMNRVISSPAGTGVGVGGKGGL